MSHRRDTSGGCYSILFSDAKLLDQIAIGVDILLLEVIQKAPSLANELQQAPAGMMILLVRLEMLGQMIDPGAQQGNLHLRRAGVIGVVCVLGDNFLLLFRLRCHDFLLQDN